MRLKDTWLYIVVVLIVFGFLAPYGWQVITSVTPDDEVTKLPPVLPQKMTWVHYLEVFDGKPFARYILNSFVVASASTLFSLIIGSFCAYAVARLRMRGKNLILGTVLAISMFPPIAIVSPLYLLLKSFKWLDTYLALLLPYTTFALPLTIWILTNFFKEIPAELEKAAWVDGSSLLGTFFRVTLPLSAPGIFTTAILVFIFAWNEFLFALTFTSTSASRTIPVGIAMFSGIHREFWAEMAAASIIVTIPLVIMVLFFQRRIIQGLTAGAIKG
jgi:multiple sugar transport system permease protein